MFQIMMHVMQEVRFWLQMHALIKMLKRMEPTTILH